MTFPGPSELGRGVVVLPGQPVPAPWAGCARVVVGDGALRHPEPTLELLHSAWLSRRPIAVELACEPAALRAPECYDGAVYELDPSFEFPVERLQFLVWANTYDGRRGDPVWWHAVKAVRRLARHGVALGGRADVCLEDGTALYIDGGPPDPPELPTATAVVHRWSAEAGSLLVARHRPPAAELAPDQLAAVGHGAGGARVIAPAGSGKTRVLTERLRHLVIDRAVHPSTVTAVAFNTQAAEEMRERCAAAVGPAGPSIRTLNSLGLWICNELGGGPGRLEVLDEPAARDLVQAVFPVRRQANTDTVAPYLDALGAIRLGLCHPDAVESEIPDAAGVAERFADFRAALAARQSVDFDEQIYRAIEILLTDPGARERARQRCRRLLVDEFQDLTPGHLLLIRLLCAPGYDCFGVGDDDQVIYGYSGATPEFLMGFPRYFPGAGHHALEVNYRCPPAVVGAATRLLSYNRRRLGKTIFPAEGRTDGTALGRGPLAGKGPLAVVTAPGEELAHRCIEVIGAWQEAGVAVQDMVVLARVNSALLPVLIGCLEAGIPAASALGPTVLGRTGIRTALAYLRIGCSEGHISRADVVDTIHRPTRKISRNVAEMLTERTGTSVSDIRRLARRLSGGDVRKLVAYADDLEKVAGACRISAAAALRVVRVDVGLGASMDVLDASRREADRSTHADDLLALESVASLHPEPGSFEPWLREILSRRAPGGPAVLLSTVHKIKGKEWPRVVVFGATAGLFPHRLGNDVEGERRVFHVAITRARTQVAVLADQPSPSPFLGELDRQAPLESAARVPPAPTPTREVRSPRDLPAVVAAPGLLLHHGGHAATVAEVRTTGAVVQIGSLRTELPFGAEVRVNGRLATLRGPGVGTGGLGEPCAAESVLRSWRSTVAKADRVPAYVILSDRDLRGIAERMPTSLAELASCRGMGAIRLERYGDEILAALEPLATVGLTPTEIPGRQQ